ncbi:uncharacterized protein AMSG_05491 [Thecamonas trahens ATCC 50062]|uniref:Uncharacterized protein n=1 Tax=Thecamonas trahens ATCC 50062 TaxID=461836 RepID=A0A0L0DB52_THETB|nr:hypothetical protein AMSG_05491 [Thecamonas trahens ATCC 50062]KNC49475.1 hypothetical protein AMSG_05491 [Thecamonas trahens ATCC 50062]|eukprot:XP_013757894.1 hypothetical protein AMSG_05491 [Thecamonas trahens ATCC 50062]
MTSRLEAAFRELDAREAALAAFYSPNPSPAPTAAHAPPARTPAASPGADLLTLPEPLPAIGAEGSFLRDGSTADAYVVPRATSRSRHRFARMLAEDSLSAAVSSENPLAAVQLREHKLLIRDCPPVTIVHGFFASPFDDLANNPFSLTDSPARARALQRGDGSGSDSDSNDNDGDRRSRSPLDIDPLFRTPAQKREAFDAKYAARRSGAKSAPRPRSQAAVRRRPASRAARQLRSSRGRHPRAKSSLGHRPPSRGSATFITAPGAGGSPAPDVHKPFLHDPLATGYRPPYATRTLREVVLDEEADQRHRDFDQLFVTADSAKRDWLRPASRALPDASASLRRTCPVPESSEEHSPTVYSPATPASPSLRRLRSDALNTSESLASVGTTSSELDATLVSMPASPQWQVRTVVGVEAVAQSSAAEIDKELAARKLQLHTAIREAFHGGSLARKTYAGIRVDELFSKVATEHLHAQNKTKFKSAAHKLLQRQRARRGSVNLKRPPALDSSPLRPLAPLSLRTRSDSESALAAVNALDSDDLAVDSTIKAEADDNAAIDTNALRRSSMMAATFSNSSIEKLKQRRNSSRRGSTAAAMVASGVWSIDIQLLSPHLAGLRAEASESGPRDLVFALDVAATPPSLHDAGLYSFRIMATSQMELTTTVFSVEVVDDDTRSRTIMRPLGYNPANSLLVLPQTKATLLSLPDLLPWVTTPAQLFGRRIQLRIYAQPPSARRGSVAAATLASLRGGSDSNFGSAATTSPSGARLVFEAGLLFVPSSQA